MTKNIPPTELTESELDTAAGGYKPRLDGVMITSFSTSGATESPPTEGLSMGYTTIKHSYKRLDPAS